MGTTWQGVARGFGLLGLLLFGVRPGWADDAARATAGQSPQRFVAGTNDYPPWYFDARSDAVRPGAAVEASRDVARRAGFEIDIAALPNARLQQSLQDGAVDFVLAPDEPVLRRDNLDCGTIGAIARILVSSASAPITSLHELGGKRIGLARHYGFESGLGTATGAMAVPLDSIEQGMRMLIAGRLDGVLGLETAFHHLEATVPGILGNLAPALVVARQDIVIWVSPVSPLKDRCKALSSVAATIRADKSVDRVLSRY
jgi:ABC-type amino acid transport substrate-binding protein